ncbi:MAG TPA: hypothetical protein PLZ36_17670, partial [Armatimonadota bacterium]|nr:hypothetical protein [Armatimonadota bacterium]
DRYLDEALPAAQAIARVKTVDGASGPTQVARQLYQPLLTAKREADAVALHAQVQAALTALNAPEDLILAELSDYLRALVDTRAPQFVAEVAAVRALLTRATTPAAAAFPLSLANRLYLPLMQRERPVEVDAVFRDATALLKRVQAPVELHVAHSQAYFTALEATDPAAFLTKALPVAQATLQGTTDAEVQFGQDLAGRLYRPLVAAKRAGETKALHAQVLAALQRRGDPQQTRTLLAWSRYMEAVSQMPDAEVMADLTPFLSRLATAAKPEEGMPLIGLGQRLYLPLMKADRAKDARTLFTATQDALGRIHAGEVNRAANVGWYFDALRATNPDQFLGEALAFVMGMTALGGPTEAARVQYLAAQLYAPLLQAKRRPDAVALHKKMQALTTEATHILPRHADSGAYLGVLHFADPSAFLTEGQQEVHAALQAATAPEHVGLALRLAHQMYELLMIAKRVEEHGRLHAAIQQALAKFGDGQHAKALADRDDYGALLARINPKQFAIEAEAVLEQAYRVTRLAQWPLTPGYLQRYFTRLLAENEVERAQMTHRRLREALGRIEGGTPLAREVTHVYWAAAAQARPTELLADGI